MSDPRPPIPPPPALSGIDAEALAAFADGPKAPDTAARGAPDARSAPAPASRRTPRRRGPGDDGAPSSKPPGAAGSPRRGKRAVTVHVADALLEALDAWCEQEGVGRGDAIVTAHLRHGGEVHERLQAGAGDEERLKLGLRPAATGGALPRGRPCNTWFTDEGVEALDSAAAQLHITRRRWVHELLSAMFGDA